MIKRRIQQRTKTKQNSSIEVKKMVLIILIIGFFLLPATALAQDVQLNVDVNPEVAREGEILTIIIEFESEQNIGTIHSDLSYDEELLEYQSGGGNVAQLRAGEGSISDSLSGEAKSRRYEFAFLAKKSGETQFSVDFSEVISFELGSFLGGPEKDLNITIEEPLDDEETSDDGEDDEDQEEGTLSLSTKHPFNLFSIYQQISGYEIILGTMDETSILKYNAEYLPDEVSLVFASTDKRDPKLYFYDARENSLQQAWVTETTIEKEIDQEGAVSSETMEEDNTKELLSWPILLLIITATILIMTIVFLEQIREKAKNNKQQGES